jgi:PST family polysaccharide transporter
MSSRGGTLEGRAARGLGYAVITFTCERGLIFVATLVLARVLVPSEFGIVAFALAIMNYLDALTDLGLGSALIYRADGTDDDVSSTSFWLSISGACVLAAGMFLAAPAIAHVGLRDAAAQHQVIPLLRTLSLMFPISALGTVHEYRLRAALDFDRIFAPRFAGAFVLGLVSLVAALSGAGAWALILGQIAGEATRTIGFWLVHHWRPRFVIARDKVRNLLRYGLGIVVVGLLGNGAKNFDYIVVGAKLGSTALGFYYLAFRLPELIVLSVFQVGNDVLFPFYARLNDAKAAAAEAMPGGGEVVDAGAALRSGYLDSVRLAAAIAFPASIGMAALASPIVLTFYGSTYRSSIAPLTFVALWTGLASLASMPGAVFKALGRSWLLTATGIMQLAILFPAILIAVDHGIAAVAASQVIEKTISLTLLGVVIGRVIGIAWYATWKAAAPSIALSLVMGAVVLGVARTFAPLTALVLGVLAGVAVYLVLVRAFMPDVFVKLTAPVRAVQTRHARRSSLELPVEVG